MMVSAIVKTTVVPFVFYGMHFNSIELTLLLQADADFTNIFANNRTSGLAHP